MRFSDVLIARLLIARSPEEMIQYYAEKIAYKPEAFPHILDISVFEFNVVPMLKNRNMTPEQISKVRYDNVFKDSVKILTDIVRHLASNNLLSYIEFVLFKTTDKRLPEDMENIETYLKAFDQLKKSPIPNFQKDIQRFSSFTELQNYLEPYMADIEKQKLLMNPEYVQKHQKTEAITIVLQEGPYEVIKIVSADASADLCRHTGWCVKDPAYFKEYQMGPNNPLYLISKDGYKYALISFGTGQVKDAQDRPISNTPELAKELKPLIIKLYKMVGGNPNDHDLEGLSSETGIDFKGKTIESVSLLDFHHGESWISANITRSDVSPINIDIYSNHSDPEGGGYSYPLAQVKFDKETENEIKQHQEYTKNMNEKLNILRKNTTLFNFISSLGGISGFLRMISQEHNPNINQKELKRVLNEIVYEPARKLGFNETELLEALKYHFGRTDEVSSKFKDYIKDKVLNSPEYQKIYQERFAE